MKERFSKMKSEQMKRKKLVASIALWIDSRSKYWTGTKGDVALRSIASDLINGEWEEDTLGGTKESNQ